jgi:hypothetical protein
VYACEEVMRVECVCVHVFVHARVWMYMCMRVCGMNTVRHRASPGISHSLQVGQLCIDQLGGQRPHPAPHHDLLKA